MKNYEIQQCLLQYIFHSVSLCYSLFVEIVHLFQSHLFLGDSAEEHKSE